MERKDVEEMLTDANRDARNRLSARTKTENSDTKKHQKPQHTGSDCVKVRSFRAAVVCLVLLCVLLLTAVILLGVDLHNTIEEFYTKNKNITDEIDQLTDNKNDLEKNITTLSVDKKNLIDKNLVLKEKMTDLWQQIRKMDGWVCHQSSLYFVSSRKKKWTESKNDCTERGGDLMIMNSKEQKEFFEKYGEFWIGLTDREGSWKWINGSTLNADFWMNGEPNRDRTENCVVTSSSGWRDFSCDEDFKWICEIKTS
ncbi:CD209 antigen-like protein C [Carassius gibelio]|uniref:CD209 antigen-like protein C n=1 Tax=Carassius gibelio TaxID=101364 RepID=UPI002277CAE0|nr:CD209 antigen-like protein C [Carassius gibelio]